MYRDNIAFRYLAGTSRGLDSRQFVTELHDRGCTRDDAIEAVCQVFSVPRDAARLFVASHPAWAADATAEEDATAHEPEWLLPFTLRGPGQGWPHHPGGN
jgi:hypothetical protein